MKGQVKGQISMFDIPTVSVHTPVKESKPKQQKFKFMLYIGAWKASVVISAYSARQAAFLFHKQYGNVYIDDICIV